MRAMWCSPIREIHSCSTLLLVKTAPRARTSLHHIEESLSQSDCSRCAMRACSLQQGKLNRPDRAVAQNSPVQQRPESRATITACRLRTAQLLLCVGNSAVLVDMQTAHRRNLSEQDHPVKIRFSRKSIRLSQTACSPLLL
jgi:hypothetical protein